MDGRLYVLFVVKLSCDVHLSVPILLGAGWVP
jgi:hypothetical protein